MAWVGEVLDVEFTLGIVLVLSPATAHRRQRNGPIK